MIGHQCAMPQPARAAHQHCPSQPHPIHNRKASITVPEVNAQALPIAKPSDTPCSVQVLTPPLRPNQPPLTNRSCPIEPHRIDAKMPDAIPHRPS